MTPDDSFDATPTHSAPTAGRRARSALGLVVLLVLLGIVAAVVITIVVLMVVIVLNNAL